MRNTHIDMPLHHIEYWTGTFFRAACLWEVGNYILVPHYSARGSLCSELTFQKEALEIFQQERDQAEQALLLHAASSAASAASGADHGWGDRLNDEEEKECEEQDIDQLDEDFYDDIQVSAGYLDRKLPLIATHSHPLSLPKGTADKVTHGHHLPHDHLPHVPINSIDSPDVPQGAAPHLANDAAPNAHPGRDSLYNAYVRVIHVNGVHHLALVTCSCLGTESIHANLMSCRLIPTTFKRYRTLFTAVVLDDFRISNLECKVSAYQYYNKLRRLTNPAAPGNVPSFYHELLRLSRLWRWMKKLKWAGYGHRSADPKTPKSGELANFCPACPQPGINLPPNWKDDKNRWDNSFEQFRTSHNRS
jgi:CxC2 like cysteine cluster associated with KDZ transposases